MKPVLVDRIPIGDPEDPVVYAGFAIAAWEKTVKAIQLKESGLEPTMWKIGLAQNQFSQTVDLWCEEYQKEDLILAQLAGLIQ